MKRTFLLFTLVAMFLLSCSTKANKIQNINEIENKIDVYIGGSFLNNEGEIVACYWKNGVRNEIDGLQVITLTVVDEKVYAAGRYEYDFSLEPPEAIYCYWIDGDPYELPGCTSVRNICVDNGKVYVVGMNGHMGRWVDEDTWEETHWEQGYWVNGIYQSPPKDSHILAIKEVNGVVYTSGYYSINETNYACYWINGIRKELPNSELFAAYGIEVINNNIYVAATNNNQGCYWVNGKQYILNNHDEKNIGFKSLTVFNDKVYFIGRYNYWINTKIHEIHDLPERTNNSSSRLTLGEYKFIDEKLYIVGSEWDERNSLVWYWVNGEFYYLNGYNATSIYLNNLINK